MPGIKCGIHKMTSKEPWSLSLGKGIKTYNLNQNISQNNKV